MAHENIQYSRHARRRMKLYGLSEDDVFSVIRHVSADLAFAEGKHEIIGENVFSQSGYPIKVVFLCQGDQLIVITAYPLKKGLRE